jgi:plastocyanin
MDILQFYSSPEQIQALANFAHNVPGYILCLVAVLFLVAEFGYHRKQLAILYSAIFIAMPVTFIGFVFLSNGIHNIGKLVSIISQYPEVYLHVFTLIGNLWGGIGEILYVRGKIRHPLGALFFPVIFIVDGYLSILHPHGAGGHHDIFHNVYGSVMVLAGLLIITGRLISVEWRKYFIALAAICIVIPGVMLIHFKESADAYSYAFSANTATSTPTFISADSNVIVYISDTHGAVPHDIQVRKGATVTFVQLDDSVHEMESGPHPLHNEYPPLNMGVLRRGEEREVSFTQVGSFGYHDHINHDDTRFQGSITVTK